MATYQNNPIVSLPYLYISGLNVSVASTTVLAISAGQCRDSNDVLDIPVNFQNLQGLTSPSVQYNNYLSGLFINSAVNGINGLDTGTLAASTNYAVYVIADSSGYNLPGGLLSLTSNSAPFLPSGYDSYRLLSTISTTSSTTFVASSNPTQWLSKSQTYGLQPAISVLSGGNSASFAAVALNGAIPTTTLPNVLVTLLVSFIPSSASSTVSFRPSGSSATTSLPTINAVASGIAQTQYITVFAGVASNLPSLEYKVSSTSDAVSLSVVSYTACPKTAIPS